MPGIIEFPTLVQGDEGDAAQFFSFRGRPRGRSVWLKSRRKWEFRAGWSQGIAPLGVG